MNNTFLNLVKTRTSCRNYLAETVSPEAINYCLEAARWAPSACNKQPWRFIVVDAPELKQRISAGGLLPGVPMPWVAQAPVIVVICVRKTILTHWLAPLISGIKYHLIDIGIAGEHFVLAAQEQGLGTCWIGWFNKKSVKKILNLPNELEPVSMLTLGHPATENCTGTRLDLNEISQYNRSTADKR
jgi:nitroreductase